MQPFTDFIGHDLADAQRAYLAEAVEQVWGEEAVGVDNIVAVHIRHIREKIEINPKEPRYLKVVWGQGYKMESPGKERLL